MTFRSAVGTLILRLSYLTSRSIAGTMYRSDAYEEVYCKEGKPREGATMMTVPSYQWQSLAGRRAMHRLPVSPMFPPTVSTVLLQEGKGSLR